jgi:hypothetical protein
MRVVLLAAGTVLGLAGCAGQRIEGGVFHGRTYRVVVPDGWAVELDSRADLALSRRAAPGGLLVNATCEGREPARSLGVLTRHLLFGLRDRRILEREAVRVQGEPAERVVFEGEGEEGRLRGEAYVVKAGGCVYDFLYVSTPGSFESGRADLDRLVQSLSRP